VISSKEKIEFIANNHDFLNSLTASNLSSINIASIFAISDSFKLLV